LVEALSVGIGGGLEQECWNLGGCGTGSSGGFQIGVDQSTDQTGIGAGGFELVNLFRTGAGRDSAPLNKADEAAAGHTGREPSHQLSGADGLGFTRCGSESHSKQKQKS
jgi:hypothetical protein